jgi:hypothetical protein
MKNLENMNVVELSKLNNSLADKLNKGIFFKVTVFANKEVALKRVVALIGEL